MELTYNKKMSGAAALSAAKNRRGNSQPSQPPPSTPTPTRNQIVNSQSSDKELPKPQNPIQALQLHEIRLNRAEKIHDELHSSITALAQKLDSNNKTQSNAPSANVNVEQMTQLHNRISQLEEIFHHLKEDIFRVQTFAMETNMSFLKFKASNDAAVAAAVAPSASAAAAPLSPVDTNISFQVKETPLSLSQIADSSIHN